MKLLEAPKAAEPPPKLYSVVDRYVHPREFFAITDPATQQHFFESYPRGCVVRLVEGVPTLIVAGTLDDFPHPCKVTGIGG